MYTRCMVISSVLVAMALGYAIAQTSIGSPQNLTASLGPDGVTIVWDAPEPDNGLIGYRIQRRQVGGEALR